MKKKSIRCIVMLIVALCTVASLTAAVISQPAATVNLTKNTVITTDQLNAKVEEYRAEAKAAGSDPASVTQLYVLDIMINDELFLQGAARDGIVITDAQVAQMVAAQKQSIEQNYGITLTESDFAAIVYAQYGISMDQFSQLLRESALVDSYVQLKKADVLNNVAVPTESEISTFHRRNAASFVNPETVRLSHIFIPYGTDAENATNKATMERTLRYIQYGTTTFEKAVVDYSQDADSKGKGGDIGWLTMDNDDARLSLGDAFFEAAFQLDAGAVSGLIESNVGYHILKATAHSDAKILTLNDPINAASTMTVRQYISQLLYSQNQQTAYVNAVNALIEDLRNQATVRILL